MFKVIKIGINGKPVCNFLTVLSSNVSNIHGGSN